MTTELAATIAESSIYAPVMATITEVCELTEFEKLFTIQLPGGMQLNHNPGQFVIVSVLGVGEAPISISSSPSRTNDTFELCIRRAGDLTSVIHNLKPGDQLGVRGPFGRGFPIDKFRGKDMLLAPGGLGLAPMRSLIWEILDERHNFGRIMILYGARTPSELLFKDELKELDERKDVELYLTVDKPEEGWEGQTGVITTLFPGITVHARNTIAVTIGPPVMYRYVLMELLSKGISDGNIWLSLERRMKCGVGKCGHCQINNVYACQDGPSFTYSEIKFLQEAL
ncbi:MAG: FAD/NAD(P)-binding protein [Anaerolineales bacterium]|nr:FAD/NAD(P)-binding protein [Anaerolineales bacterium]